MITKHIVETTREYDAQGNLVSENIIETDGVDDTPSTPKVITTTYK